jgi:clan AA aspartic protease
MAIFATHITVANPQEPDRGRDIEVVIDTGATLTKLPARLLSELGIQPRFSIPTITSENREIIRSVGQAWIRIDGRAGIVPVSFGNQEEPVLLGATALEILGFVVDPVDQKLISRPLRDK